MYIKAIELVHATSQSNHNAIKLATWCEDPSNREEFHDTAEINELLTETDTHFIAEWINLDLL